MKVAARVRKNVGKEESGKKPVLECVGARVHGVPDAAANMIQSYFSGVA